MATIVQRGDSWRALVRIKGFPTETSTFGTEQEARDWAELREKALKKTVPQVAKIYTVGMLIDKYKKTRATSGDEIERGSQHDYILRHLDADLGAMDAAKITSKDVIDWVENRVKNKAGKQALYQEVSCLKKIFKLAPPLLGIKLHDQYHEVESAMHVVVQMKLVTGVSTMRERRPTENELNLILGTLDPQKQDIVRIADILCLRQGEILKLKWSDLNHDNKMIWVRGRKDPRGKQHDDNVALVLGSREILLRQPKVHEKIFPFVTGENVSDAFLNACRLHKIEDLHYHDLRHDSISKLFELGLAIQEVALFSGHRSWTHLRRYTNLQPKNMHKTIADLLVNPNTQQPQSN